MVICTLRALLRNRLLPLFSSCLLGITLARTNSFLFLLQARQRSHVLLPASGMCGCNTDRDSDNPSFSLCASYLSLLGYDAPVPVRSTQSQLKQDYRPPWALPLRWATTVCESTAITITGVACNRNHLLEAYCQPTPNLRHKIDDMELIQGKWI